MLDMLKRAGARVRRYVREEEPLAAISALCAVIVGLVGEWQGDYHGEAAWVAVAWGVATFLARRHVTPAANPAPPAGAPGGQAFAMRGPDLRPGLRRHHLFRAIALSAVVVGALGLAPPSPAGAAEPEHIDYGEWEQFGYHTCYLQARLVNYNGNAVAQMRTNPAAGSPWTSSCDWNSGIRVYARGWDGGIYTPPAGCSVKNVLTSNAPPGCTGWATGSGSTREWFLQSAHPGTVFAAFFHQCYPSGTDVFCWDRDLTIF